MQLAGLSLEQAPPFSVPMRFFMTAPAFAVAAAAVWGLAGPEILLSRWTPSLLIVVHLVTLGFATLTMIGATLQMLPVVAGATVVSPRASSALVHGLVTLGTVALAFAFARSRPLPYLVAVLLLGLGAGLFVVVAAGALRRGQAGGESVVSMGIAVAALAVTAGLGLVLTLGYGAMTAFLRSPLTDIHLAWGLFGWMGLLIVGVAYQVVPMFQITPAYPGWMRRGLAPWLLLWVAVSSLAALLPPGPGRGAVSVVAELGLGGGLVAFAVVTLDLQRRRRRKLEDVTLSFWRLAMVLLIAAVLLASGLRRVDSTVLGPGIQLLPAMLFLMGFVVSVINGMLYKIVPFLVWFHLQALATASLAAGGKPGPTPNMKQVIPDRWARRQYRVHLAAIVVLAAATIGPDALRVGAGILWGGSMLLLWVNLGRAVAVYRRAATVATRYRR